MRRYKASAAEINAVESTDPTELDTLADHQNKFVRSRVAKNAATGRDTLARLAKDPDGYVRTAVAKHPNTPAETLAAMSSVPDSAYVRSALARNPHTPTSTLKPAASDDYFTRRSIAGNPNTDPDILREMAADRDNTVAEEVAKNPATPDDAVLTLIEHWSGGVAEAISRRNRNPNPTRWRTITVSTKVGRSYSTSTKQIPVEEGGRFTPEQIEAMAASKHAILQRTAASQPDAPAHVLSTLASHEDMWVRARVAENEGASADLILHMAQEEDEARLLPMLAKREHLNDEAIIAIASRKVPTAHAALPARAADVLLSNSDPKVRARAALLHRREQSEVWDRMLTDGDAEVRAAAAYQCPDDVLDAQVAHPCRKVREVVADLTRNPEVLFSLSSDAEVTVRRRVVKNKGCPGEAMMALAADPDERVRRHASARFMDAMTRNL